VYLWEGSCYNFWIRMLEVRALPRQPPPVQVRARSLLSWPPYREESLVVSSGQYGMGVG